MVFIKSNSRLFALLYNIVYKDPDPLKSKNFFFFFFEQEETLNRRRLWASVWLDQVGLREKERGGEETCRLRQEERGAELQESE